MKKFATLALCLALGVAAVATTGCGDEKKSVTTTKSGPGGTVSGTATTNK